MPIRWMGRWVLPVALAAMAAAPRISAQSLADSVRPYLVFAPRGERWFVASNRGKRMLLDIGRVDLNVRKDSAIAAAFRATAAASSPVPIGTRFRLRAPWGEEQVQATALDSWSGRIVLVLSGSARMDSVARRAQVVVASAWRESPTTPAAAQSGAVQCDRTPVRGIVADRLRQLRDSLDGAMRSSELPPYPRLARRLTTVSSQVSGCFGAARVILSVTLRAPAIEWSRERVVAVDTAGRAREVTVDDLRFRVHALLHAVDADGDGVDDIAAVGRAHRAGATTILRYDPEGRRIVRLAAGFAWEDP